MEAILPNPPAARAHTLAKALRLEYLTIGWNVVEGVVAVTAALAAGSVALLAFGIDSFVECTSGAILIWRLRAEKTAADVAAIERLDRRAHQLVGASLFALAAWVAFDAAKALWAQERPEPSVVGLVLLALSIAVMYWLARAKRRAAAALNSRALEADSFQTSACFWLSIVGLAGIGLNAALGWWWADPVAALGSTATLSAPPSKPPAFASRTTRSSQARFRSGSSPPGAPRLRRTGDACHLIDDRALAARASSERVGELVAGHCEYGELFLGPCQRCANLHDFVLAGRGMVADGAQHRVDLLKVQPHVLELLDELDALDRGLVEDPVPRAPSKSDRQQPQLLVVTDCVDPDANPRGDLSDLQLSHVAMVT